MAHIAPQRNPKSQWTPLRGTLPGSTNKHVNRNKPHSPPSSSRQRPPFRLLNGHLGQCQDMVEKEIPRLRRATDRKCINKKVKRKMVLEEMQKELPMWCTANTHTVGSPSGNKRDRCQGTSDRLTSKGHTFQPLCLRTGHKGKEVDGVEHEQL